MTHSLTVPRPPDAAFRRFADGLPDRWPAACRSRAARKGRRLARIEATPGKGGAITEIAADGIRASWATITGREPGRRLAPSSACDNGTGSMSEEVTFIPVRTGTRVDLTTGASAVWQATLPALAAQSCALLAA